MATFGKRVNEAILYAGKAHAGQLDKGGEPYILHPLRVGMAFSLASYRKLSAGIGEEFFESCLILGVLHDVIEDTDAILPDVAADIGLKDDEIAALDCLTKREGESYEDYLTRLSSNKLAVEVKIEDLSDNLFRTVYATYIKESKQIEMLRKYCAALAYLSGAEKTIQSALVTVNANSAQSVLRLAQRYIEDVM